MISRKRNNNNRMCQDSFVYIDLFLYQKCVKIYEYRPKGLNTTLHWNPRSRIKSEKFSKAKRKKARK